MPGSRLILVLTLAASIGASCSAGPAVTPSPTPSASPSPSPSPSAAPSAAPSPAPSLSPAAVGLLLPASGSLAAGTYYYTLPDPSHIGSTAKRITFTVPEGWANADPFVLKHHGEPGEVGFTTWVVTDVYTDACHWHDTLLTHVDSGPDALIRALRDQGGREEAAGGWPWQGTVGGFSAEGIALVVPADLDTTTCTGHILRYWPDPGPDFSGGLCCNLPGNTDFIYAVDINGRTLAVVARHYAASSTADLAELDGVINSLRFEP
jgi:hypothetical protein